MLSKLHFKTKEEANHRREKEFLALIPSERVQVFIRMVVSNGFFESGAAQPKNNGNFVIKKKSIL
jgi:hypothetical protein